MDLDEFSDDGLDDLPEKALREIENQAIQFTQAQAQLTQQQPRSSIDAFAQKSDYGWGEDDDLDTAQVVNDAGIPISRLPCLPKAQTATQSSPNPSRPIPTRVPNPQWNPTLAQNARLNASMAQTPPPPRAGLITPSQRFNQSQAPVATGQVPQLTQTQPGDVLSALQIRIRALEYDLNAARGEASIIRANSVKAQREFDAQVSKLKQANAEQAAKHNRMVEAAVTAERSANTELQFMKQDMKEVSDRARRKEAAGPVGSIATTPKKAGGRSWGIADGFDEMDIAMSPSKGLGKGRQAGSVAANVGERTPTKGKRKRPTMDSPIMALEIDTTDIVMGEDKLDLSQSSQIQTHIAPPAAPYEVSGYSRIAIYRLLLTLARSFCNSFLIMEAFINNHPPLISCLALHSPLILPLHRSLPKYSSDYRLWAIHTGPCNSRLILLKSSSLYGVAASRSSIGHP